MSSFRRQGDAVVVAFDEVEASLLRHLVSEVNDLLEPQRPARPTGQAHSDVADPDVTDPDLADPDVADPDLADLDVDDLADDLADLDAPAEPPTDPVLARLLPDGYRDDADSAQEFRRLTESELRRQKRESAGRLLAELPEGGGEVRLDPETTERWLATLNDVRLALGTRLDVTEDMDEPAEDDPDAAAYVVYAWLTQLQDVLVQVALEHDG